MMRRLRIAGLGMGALAIAAALLWACTPWLDILLWRTSPPHCYEVHAILGCIIAGEGGHGPHMAIRTGQFWRDPDWSWWFHYTRDGILIIPLWSVLMASGASSFLLLRASRRLAHRPDQCQACGYDRRGIRPTALCPECGRNPASIRAPVTRVPGPGKLQP